MNIDDLKQALQAQLPFLRLKQYSLPLTPEITLWLVDEAKLKQDLSQAEFNQALHEPAYWCFCWASGQVLAAALLQQRHLVKGKRVLDMGSGSGVVAIAAKMAGAEEVVACDIDPVANLALACNAESNGVSICSVSTLDPAMSAQTFDLVLAADVLYDRDNYPILEQLKHYAPEVLIADSRVKVFPDNSYEKVFEAEARTWPDLDESACYNRVSVYRWLLDQK